LALITRDFGVRCVKLDMSRDTEPHSQHVPSLILVATTLGLLCLGCVQSRLEPPKGTGRIRTENRLKLRAPLYHVDASCCTKLHTQAHLHRSRDRPASGVLLDIASDSQSTTQVFFAFRVVRGSKAPWRSIPVDGMPLALVSQCRSPR